jgi:DNA-binding MurR/RpiR family transcriptional regulator
VSPVTADPPYALDGLKETIATRFDALPARLQAAARYLLDHPNAAAVDTIKVLSGAAGLQPSVLVRLAKTFGYSGFTEMQGVFREALLAQTQSYGERMRGQMRERRGTLSRAPGDVLRMLCDGAIGSLQGLRDSADPAALRDAIALLCGARSINVVGLRRAWPVATYFAYLMSRSQRFTRLLGGIGGMLSDDVRALCSNDVVVAISFHPFHADTVGAAELARTQGVPVLALSDSTLSPFARTAKVLIEVRDADIAGFRVVAASMALCQALAVGMLVEETARRKGANQPKSLATGKKGPSKQA